jgi:filamentous hemagglutinin
VTDTRAGAPKDARWQGVQVMTRDQVQARSEFTLTRASTFFADSRSRPQDAGLLSVGTSGSGTDALKLDAVYDLVAGPGGRGAQVDISALKLAVTSGTPGAIDPEAVVLDAGKLNALGADSLFIGGTRTASGDTTTLAVGAESVTFANDADHALKAGEILLAAKDTLTLKAGSAIDAQGQAGDAGTYETTGNGAFVRAASARATFTRTGSPDRSVGTLVGEAGSTLAAADSITLDATRENAYQGTTAFEKEQVDKNGVATRVPVPGNLAVGATRVNFGAAPASAEGMTYSQAELDTFASLKGLTLTSYSSFDLYGDVKVGGIVDNKPTLQNLSLQGAGLAGIDNASQTAQLNAHKLTLANTAAAAFTPVGALGSGNLAVTADTLTLGKGDKAIQGFGEVTITASELVGSGTGSLDVTAPVTLNVARISGERDADQTLASAGALVVAQHSADRTLAPVNALGAEWALAGTRVDFDSKVELPSGSFKLSASSGDIKLNEHAQVDVAGRVVQFFDAAKPSWGGTAEFVSETGKVDFAAGAKVDVSAAAGGDVGTLTVRAANGTFTVADGSVGGGVPVDAAGQHGEGAHAEIDVGSLANFSALNAALNSGGFNAERKLRVRSGDVNVAAGDTAAAHAIKIAADNGQINVAGTLDASGSTAGSIELYASHDVNVLGTLNARSSAAGQDGGDVVIGTTAGSLNLASAGSIDVAGGAGGRGGSVLLRAPRTSNDVAVTAVDSTTSGARSVAIEAVKSYANIATLTATGTSSSATLSLATIKTDNTAFAGNYAMIKSRLGKSDDAAFHILSGVEVRSAGDLALGTGVAATDWNLSTARANGEAGVLTLRADGNLKINSNLSDGFSVATPFSSGTTPATLLSGDSWSYRLVAGADSAAADPLAVKSGSKDFTLAAGKLIRTGTGDIRIASGRNITLADTKAVIYSAGRSAGGVSGFTQPPANAGAFFSRDGGDVSLAALGNITGAASTQLFNNWLFRQGALSADGSTYTTQPAWWVRFDQFQQGVGALGGGDVRISAGGTVTNLSAHAPTQARIASASPGANALVETGGGTVWVEAGGDILGGQYYADRGDLVLLAGGKVDSGQSVFGNPLYTILALGDGVARVRASGDVNVQAVLNPQLLSQSKTGTTKTTFNVAINTANRNSVFSTYSHTSAANLMSLDGGVNLSDSAMLNLIYAAPLNDGASNAKIDSLNLMPSNLSLVAFQGDVGITGSDKVMLPAPDATLALLARNAVNLNASLIMSDSDPTRIPGMVAPASTTANSVLAVVGNKYDPAFHAPTPVHADDPDPAHVYAVEGDVVGVSQTQGGQTYLDIPKAFVVQAGRDVLNVSIEAQHAGANPYSRVQAGRDIVFDTGNMRSDEDHIQLGGAGQLDVIAGRTIDLGTSGGIVSRGNLVNPALPALGADIHIAAGVGANGVDYAGAITRLLAALDNGAPDDATLWQARWLTGNHTLTAGNALAAVRAIAALDADAQQASVRTMLYTALRETGRDSNNKDSPYAADYARGYAAIDQVFPGIGVKNPDGSFKNYQGDINLFASRVKTESGGNIEWLAPGGDMIVGLANTPQALVDTGSNVLGVVTSATGDIKGFSRGDVLVNQSRILTVGGGDVLLWSSEGDIDAGKGKKTAVSVPPPLILVDSKGNVTQVLQGAASGSGIGALQPAGGTAGDVDLVAPKGTVNAGDAGIRAGNLNIAASLVIGADNISVTGSSSGTPVADTSAVTAASSGASNADGGMSNATAALSNNLSEAARAAEELKKSFKPTFISAEVVGHGE